MSYDVGVECTGSDAILPGVEYWCCHLVVFFFSLQFGFLI